MGSNFLRVLLFAFKWPILWIIPQRQITPLNQKWFMYTLSLVLILKIWYGRKKTKNNATFPLPNQGLDLILGLYLRLIINLDHFESTNILLSIDKMASFPVSELRFSTFEQLFFFAMKMRCWQRKSILSICLLQLISLRNIQKWRHATRGEEGTQFGDTLYRVARKTAILVWLGEVRKSHHPSQMPS